MRRILVDTNVIIDLLAKREPFDIASRSLFSLADMGEEELVTSSLSLVNTHYILHDVMKIKEARSVIGKFKVLVKTHALTDKIVELALNDYAFKDFEDAIQYYTALESKCELIVTRNTKDFKTAKIPTFTPQEYLAKREAK
jgi:predicted nucleic acid-binding protein